MKRYNPKEIEPKWQQKWADNKIYEAEDSVAKPKKYILEYFPYPSGAAMHVGHVRNYTIGDVLSRHARMAGFNVMHPMGWDAFGLPAENYAIKTGISPQEAVANNVARFKKQLTQMGFGYDWSREINSTDPNYYKWTQWFFLLLFRRGLAYQKDSAQWWCPVDKTVLANEQVENGQCWRCGSMVEKKTLKQWFFKITDYADRLAKDLDDVDWTDSIKTMQRNWIGRSVGAEITFAIDGHDQKLHIFTTRPDTIFGATFMVVAPEHPLTKQITASEQRDDVNNYIEQTQAKSDIERQETGREKTGAFTGAYAINPVNNERIPIWTADYVLAGYGTGAIIAVPAHDERDYEFARKFDLPITPVVTPTFREYHPNATTRPSAVVIARDPENDTYCAIEWTKIYKGEWCWPGGGLGEGESVADGAAREFREETGYTDFTIDAVLPAATSMYYDNTKSDSAAFPLQRSVRYVVTATLRSHANAGQTGEAYEKDAFKIHWLSKTEILERMREDWRTQAEYAFDGGIHIGEGSMISSGPYDNLRTEEMREKIVADLQKKGVANVRVNYKIRDWLISRQRYWGAPIPMIHCETCGTVPVPENQLPVVLPGMESYEPAGDGHSPLARVDDWVNVACPKCGSPARRETDTMDGFACSSWYFLRYADPHNDEHAFDPEKVKHWLPVEDYIGGAEHAVMHLLYARMWTKVMQDEGLIDFGEPFKTLRNHGMILAPDGQKMSKSKGNTIEPDVLIDQGYGADAIRIMELFIGPWDQAANWSIGGIGGSFRFLQRIWTLVCEFQENTKPKYLSQSAAHEEAIISATHKAIKKVTEDLDDLGFNTAIASLMEFTNELYRLRTQCPYNEARDVWEFALSSLLQLVAPFAPHIAEELWIEVMGKEKSVHISKWPTWDESKLVALTVPIMVQVNGKVRAKMLFAVEALSEESVVAAAKAYPKVRPYLAGKEIRKVIYVPGKLVSIVV